MSNCHLVQTRPLLKTQAYIIAISKTEFSIVDFRAPALDSL